MTTKKQVREPREFCVPESALFDTTDKCFCIYPNDPVTFMVPRYDYDQLRKEMDEAHQFIVDNNMWPQYKDYFERIQSKGEQALAVTEHWEGEG